MVVVLLVAFLFFSLGVGQCPPKIGSCDIFPITDEWNRPIDTDPVDFRSDCFISQITTWGNANNNGPYLRLDFGDGSFPYYGIPYSSGPTRSLLPISYGGGEDYSDESDCLSSTGQLVRDCSGSTQRYYPIPQNLVIEGDGDPDDPGNTQGDRHTAYIDTDKCILYETYATTRLSPGFQCASSAIYNLSQVLPQRPDYWTSCDAAGLPIFPGLLRYEEFQAGEVKHAIRFTVDGAAQAFTYPASHVGPNRIFNYPYYGARFRLKASFPETGYSAQSVILIRALKKYGMFFADQGSSIYLSGMSSSGWSSTFISEINQPNKPGTGVTHKRIHINNFEVVQSPNPVRYGSQSNPWSPTMNCNGLTGNSNPNWQPNWNPVCSSSTTATPVTTRAPTTAAATTRVPTTAVATTSVATTRVPTTAATTAATTRVATTSATTASPPGTTRAATTAATTRVATTSATTASPPGTTRVATTAATTRTAPGTTRASTTAVNPGTTATATEATTEATTAATLDTTGETSGDVINSSSSITCSVFAFLLILVTLFK